MALTSVSMPVGQALVLSLVAPQHHAKAVFSAFAAIAGLLFNWLYPAHFPVIRLCLEAWTDTPEVTTALLRFMTEFVMNKNARLAFDSSSPNGILLFREVSKVSRACQ